MVNLYKALFDALYSTIDSLTSENHQAKIVSLGDFNIHNQDWLGVHKVDSQGRATESFTTNNSLTNLLTYFLRV